MKPALASGESEKPLAKPKSQIFNSQSAFTNKLPIYYIFILSLLVKLYVKYLYNILNFY